MNFRSQVNLREENFMFLYRAYYSLGGTYSSGPLSRAILILWSGTENNYLRGPTDLWREPDIISEIKARLHS